MNAVAQGKGLSQLRSIEATTVAEQLPIGGASDLNSGVDSRQSDVQHLHSLETSYHLQNEDTKNKQGDNFEQNSLLSPQNLSANPKSATQFSAADFQPDIEGQNGDRTGTQFDASEARQMANAAAGKHSEALRLTGRRNLPDLPNIRRQSLMK